MHAASSLGGSASRTSVRSRRMMKVGPCNSPSSRLAMAVGACAGDPAHRYRQVALLPDSHPWSRYDKTGALTVVISPLVASHGGSGQRGWRRAASSPASPSMDCCPCPSGLTPWIQGPPRGCGHHLIISPEQLRNRSLRPGARSSARSAPGLLDEAHCLSEVGARLPARTTATWDASSARRRGRTRSRRCCA